MQDLVARSQRRFLLSTVALVVAWCVASTTVSVAAEDAAEAETSTAGASVPDSAKTGLVLVEVVDRDGTVRQHGCGALIENTIVATNLSALRRGDRLLVGWSDGRTIPAEGVLAFDRDLDIALVKLALPADVSIAPLKVKSAPDNGETFSLTGLTAARELIARPSKIVERPQLSPPEDHLVCDAPLPEGCPGGAWMSNSGELLGLWTWSARQQAGESLGVPGQVLKNMLRRQHERVPLTLPELRRKLNTLSNVFTPLYPSRKLAPAKAEKAQAPFELRSDIRFTGPRTGDPNHLGDFRTEGGWRIADRWLVAPPETAVSLRIATADTFALEIDADAAAPGGWFVLFGADDRNGYVLSNVTLKTSGSPWHLCELRDGVCRNNTFRELGRSQWKGVQKLGLSVGGNSRGEYRLEATLNGKPLFDAVELPNYVEGDIVLATYDTRYRTKPVRIQSIRGKIR
jgi:hypothetical protein